MSANFESGVTYGQKSWHGGEVNLPADDDRRYSVEGTLEPSGMDWGVAKFPLAISPDCGEMRGYPAPLSFAIFRTDNWTQLGNVGPGYRPLQNRDIFAQFQPFLDARALAFTSAGSLDGGRKVYVQARLAVEDFEVADGDRVSPMLLIASSHDGSLATRVGWSFIRVVCQNTLAAAVGRKGLLRVRHTAGQADALNAIMATVDVARQSFTANGEQFRRLAATSLNAADLRDYVTRVFTDEGDAAPLSGQRRNTIDRVIELAINGIGNQGRTLTAWTAYNGLTQYLTHERGKTKSVEARRDSLWFGDGNATSERGLQLALALGA